MVPPKSDTLKRRTAWLLVRIGAVLGFGFVIMFSYLTAMGPHHANPNTGQTIRFGRRGIYTFHTKAQVLSLGILGGTALVFFIAGSALGWPFSNGAYERARATYQTNGDASDDV